MNLTTTQRIAGLTASICLLIQFYLIVMYWDMTHYSDAGSYILLAQECYNAGEWYPMQKHLYSQYLFSPGFVNMLILQLKLLGTLHLNMVINLLMSWMITAEVWLLARRWFNERTSWITVILNCALYSTWFYFLPAMTEIPFLFFTLSAFCLCTKKNKEGWFLLAGMLLAMANWIRPLVVVFFVVLLLLMWMERCRWQGYTMLLTGLVVSAAMIGSFTQRKIGVFAYQSTTSGVNLIMTANDDATGSVNFACMDSTKIGYIAHADYVPFTQKDSIWKARAINWMLEHPMRYAKLYAIKLGGLYIHDAGSDGTIFDSKTLSEMETTEEKMTATVMKMLRSVVYYAIGIVFIITLWKRRRDIWSSKGLLLLLLTIGTFSTCLFSVGPRYHAPFLFTIVMWAAWGINCYLTEKEQKATIC